MMSKCRRQHDERASLQLWNVHHLRDLTVTSFAVSDSLAAAFDFDERHVTANSLTLCEKKHRCIMLARKCAFMTISLI